MNTHHTDHETAAKKRAKRNGTILAIVVFAAIIGLSTWARSMTQTVSPTVPAGSDTVATSATAALPGAIDPSTLPGIQTSDAPWAPEFTNLRARLADIGLPALPEEGTALHIHQHLDIFVNGTAVPVPALIGIDDAEGFISPIHVHDTTGIIHVESPTIQTFTLGQFFDIWGVRFTQSCIGGYCASETASLRVYVNGQLYQGDPRMLALAAHQEIVVAYGTAAQLPNPIPSSFDFPAGL